MKLTWHIIKNDIVRDRWALLTWAIFFVGQDAIGVFARNYAGISTEWALGLQVASAVLVFLEVTMGYVLVARLVQADVLVGTTMFWRTRPISAGRLLTAKLLGALLLFALLPVLLLLPWWLYCQLGWREILWTAVEMLGWQLLMLAPAFLVGSLTDDLGRVLLWTLLLLIGLTSWVGLLQSTVVSPLKQWSHSTSVPLMFTRLWVCSMLLIVGSLAIATHQYLTRRFARSVGLVVFGLGLIALVGQVWIWNWGPAFASLHKPTLAAPDPGLVKQVSVTVDRVTGGFGSGFKAKTPDQRDADLHLWLHVTGMPEDKGIRTEESTRHTWSWSDGKTLTRIGGFFWPNGTSSDAMLRRAYSLPIPVEDEETLHWRKVRWEKLLAGRLARGARVYPPSFYPDSGVKLKAGESWQYGNVSLPNSYLAKMKAEPPAYRADVQWMIFSPQVIAELPLKEGARASGWGRTFLLQRMNGDKPLVISTEASVGRNGVWLSQAASSRYGGWFYRERFDTVNRVTGDLHGVENGRTNVQGLQVAGVMVTWNTLRLVPRMVIRNDQDVVADPQWREHSLLLMVEDRDFAPFEHPVEMARFELAPDRADQAAASAGP